MLGVTETEYKENVNNCWHTGRPEDCKNAQLFEKWPKQLPSQRVPT
jgi:hypothetical protein